MKILDPPLAQWSILVILWISYVTHCLKFAFERKSENQTQALIARFWTVKTYSAFDFSENTNKKEVFLCNLCLIITHNIFLDKLMNQGRMRVFFTDSVDD